MNNLTNEQRLPSLRDIFLNIFVFIMLYMAAINFGGLLFQIINQLIPDALENQYQDFRQQALKTFLATILVVFPVYMFFAFKLAKEQRLNPPLRKAKSLRLLTYLTLTIAGIIIIGSWIRLVFSLIDGD